MRRPVDKAALDRLVVDHLPHALRFAIRLTGDEAVAEEIVQEALTRAAESWASFRGEAQFRTWLLRIVINVFRDRLRRRPEPVALPEGAPDLRVVDPQQQAMANELRQEIAARVSALPPRQREVLILITYEGLKPREVAKLLETNEANVHATLHVARSRLRQELARYVAEE